MSPAAREILELHEFFAGWLRGELPATDAAFDRVASVLAESFCIVSPTGSLHERGQLLDGLRASHGRRPRLEIEVRSVVIRWQDGPSLLATYEEWQREPGRPATGRVSSAVFLQRPGTPHGLEWLHVHETWKDA